MIELEITWNGKYDIGGSINKQWPKPKFTTVKGTANECMDQFLRYVIKHPGAAIYCVRDI